MVIIFYANIDFYFASCLAFPADYLRHKDCFTYIQVDWISCTTDFENILTDDLHDDKRNVTDKFMEFCW